VPVNARLSDSMAKSHGAALSRLFSSRVIRELASMGRSPLATQILRETGADRMLGATVSLGESFDIFLKVLFRSYRSEYVYKNAIANKVLLGRHSLNTASMLTELRVLNCVADVVILNGSSCVYEIKSEFDSMTRLRRQTGTYSKVFDFVNVITSADQQEAVLHEVREEVGVLVLTNRNSISTVRKASSSKSQVDPKAVFSTLRQSEYVRIIREHFGAVPDVPNTQIYRVCRDLFSNLAPEDAHDSMVQVLRERGSSTSLRFFIEAVPPSLKALSLACELAWQERSMFVDLLQSSARQALLSL